MNARPSQIARPTSILRIVLMYAGISAHWIISSDWAVAQLFRDAELNHIASTVKGWFFVAFTSVMLFYLLRSLHISAATEAVDEVAVGDRASAGWSLALTLLAIVVITGASIAIVLKQEKQKIVAQMELVADFRDSQLERWLARREMAVEFLQAQHHLASLYRRWQTGDEQARDQLRIELGALGKLNDLRNLCLLDENGERLLWCLHERESQVRPEWQPVLQRVAASRRSETLNPFALG